MCKGLIVFLHYIRLSMRRQLFATLFIFIIGTQIFPIQGFKVWYNLLKLENAIESPNLQAIEEESLEENDLKLKEPSTSISNCYEIQSFLKYSNNRIWVVLTLGNLSDRSNPILIPPPNQFI